MRVVQLSTMAGYYGGEVCVDALARGLAARGHEVTVVTRPRSELADRLADAPLQVRRLPLVGWWEPRGLAALARLLRRTRADVLHTHVPRDHYLAALATLGAPVLSVGTRHLLHPFRHRVLKRPFLGRLDALVAVSRAVSRQLARQRLVTPDRLVTIPNGIADAAGRRPALDLRRRHGIPADAPVVGAVGRLCPSKGLDVLLRGAARLRDRWPDLRVLVVGAADPGRPERSRLAALAAARGLGGRVVFSGYVPDAARAMGSLDVLALCSEAEPCGLVTLEAMARGVPVVATGSGGSPELVRHGREGLLVPPGDPSALAAALDRLLAAPALRRRLGANGKRRVRARFDDATMVRATEELYRRLLAARATRDRAPELTPPGCPSPPVPDRR